MTKTVLAIAAHSDDEALGCAGTLAKHIANGDRVHLVFMTNGVGSRRTTDSDAEDNRKASAERAQEALGALTVTSFDFPDNAMDSVPLLNITQAVEQVVGQFKPEIIYTHHHGDLNIDHRLTHQATLTACRPQPHCSVKEIYAFEVLSSTEWQTPDCTPFLPDVFVDITDHFQTKMEMIKIYAEEMRATPHSRSIEGVTALANHRGHSMGVSYAEAFKLVRMIK